MKIISICFVFSSLIYKEMSCYFENICNVFWMSYCFLIYDLKLLWSGNTLCITSTLWNSDTHFMAQHWVYHWALRLFQCTWETYTSCSYWISVACLNVNYVRIIHMLFKSSLVFTEICLIFLSITKRKILKSPTMTKF